MSFRKWSSSARRYRLASRRPMISARQFSSTALKMKHSRWKHGCGLRQVKTLTVTAASSRNALSASRDRGGASDHRDRGIESPRLRIAPVKRRCRDVASVILARGDHRRGVRRRRHALGRRAAGRVVCASQVLRPPMRGASGRLRLLPVVAGRLPGPIGHRTRVRPHGATKNRSSWVAIVWHASCSYQGRPPAHEEVSHEDDRDAETDDSVRGIRGRGAERATGLRCRRYHWLQSGHMRIAGRRPWQSPRRRDSVTSDADGRQDHDSRSELDALAC